MEEEDEDEETVILRMKTVFWYFSVVASINHALNYVVTSFATSLLGDRLGGVTLGISWMLNSLSGLSVATLVVKRFGFKTSMIISLWGYAIQFATFFFAVYYEAHAYPIAIIGSVIAGFTSAFWWTCQGIVRCFISSLLFFELSESIQSLFCLQSISSIPVMRSNRRYPLRLRRKRMLYIAFVRTYLHIGQ